MITITLLLAIRLRWHLPQSTHHPIHQVTAVCLRDETVALHFYGSPGIELEYSGERFTISNRGYVDILYDRRYTTYHVNGVELPVLVWPIDALGFRGVPVPAPRVRSE